MMKIITYRSPEQLKGKNSAFEKYREAIHITATHSLKSGILKSMETHRWIHGPVLSFSELLPYVGNGWFRGKTTLFQNTKLSYFLRRYVESKSNYSSEVFQSVDKNQNDILRTMRTFIESDLTIEDVEEQLSNSNDEMNTEKEIFIELWRNMEKSGTVRRYRQWIQQLRKNPQQCINEAFEQFQEDLAKQPNKRRTANMTPDSELRQKVDAKVLVFHGFYYLTPFQQVVLDALEEEYEIVHLIQYEEEYQEAFKTVEEYLEMDRHEIIPATNKVPAINRISAALLQSLEGNQKRYEWNHKVKHTEYTHTYQFKSYLQSDDFEEDEQIYTARASEVRPYLATSEDLASAQLKEFPIGHFLLDIHRLNKRKYNQAERRYEDYDNASIELLYRVLNSGYLKGAHGTSSQLIQTLSKLEPVLQGCQTIADYIAYLNQHLERKEDIESSFPQDPLEKGSAYEKQIILISNRLSYFHVKREDIVSLIEALKEIESLYQLLFSEEQIKIAGYATTLQKYLEEVSAGRTGQETDYEAMQQVLEMLEDMKTETFVFDRKDLIQGITYYLSRDVAEEDVEKTQYGTQNINHFIDVDGIPFMPNQTVHLAFFDNAAMPMQQNLSIWPFERVDLKRLSQKNRYIKRIEMRHELSSEITNYLLYVATYHTLQVKFSSVKQLDPDSRLYPSFYTALLDIPVEKANVMKRSHQLQTTESIEGEPIRQYVQIPSKEYPVTLLQEEIKKRCPKRLALSLYFPEEDYFKQDFHFGFLYQNFIHYYLNPDVSQRLVSQEEVKAYIDHFFPQWTEAEKTFLYKDAMKNKKYIGDEADKMNLSHLWVKGEVEKTYVFGVKLKEENKLPINVNHCRYCPFKIQCSDSEGVTE